MFKKIKNIFKEKQSFKPNKVPVEDLEFSLIRKSYSVNELSSSIRNTHSISNISSITHLSINGAKTYISSFIEDSEDIMGSIIMNESLYSSLKRVNMHINKDMINILDYSNSKMVRSDLAETILLKCFKQPDIFETFIDRLTDIDESFCKELLLYICLSLNNRIMKKYRHRYLFDYFIMLLQ